MVTTDILIKNEFYLKPQTTTTGIEWSLASQPEKLSYLIPPYKHRIAEQFRKREDIVNIHLPVDGLSIIRLVADKLRGNAFTDRYTELAFIPPKTGRLNADNLLDFLNEQTKNTIPQSEDMLRDGILNKYGEADSIDIGHPAYSQSPDEIKLSGSPNTTITLEFGYIPVMKSGIPFYLSQPNVTHVFNLADNSHNPVVNIPPIDVNIYLTLQDDSSTPRAVYDSFKASEMAELDNERIAFEPFVNLLGNRRKIGGAPYDSNDKGGLFLNLIAETSTELNELAKYLTGTFMPRINTHGLVLEYSEKEPECINAADIAVMKQIKKDT